MNIVGNDLYTRFAVATTDGQEILIVQSENDISEKKVITDQN
jgi:hypothetical protein